MQTFLPFPSFVDSARVLDSPRLGKQRVETLQILRALVVPGYGWQRHPAVGMWRGSVPALTAYGLATIDEWTARGNADATREQVREFAPEVEGAEQDALAAAGLLPRWLGDPAVHESHRSRLIAKDPDRYRPLFPGTAEDLDYVWPPAGEAPVPPAGGQAVLRVAAVEPWRAAGVVGLPVTGPGGRITPAWRRQVEAFAEDLAPGAVVGVLADDDPAVLHLAEVAGPVLPAVVDGADHLVAAVRFGGGVERRTLPVPAALQDPKRFFHLPPVAPFRVGPGESGA